MFGKQKLISWSFAKIVRERYNEFLENALKKKLYDKITMYENMLDYVFKPFEIVHDKSPSGAPVKWIEYTKEYYRYSAMENHQPVALLGRCLDDSCVDWENLTQEEIKDIAFDNKYLAKIENMLTNTNIKQDIESDNKKLREKAKCKLRNIIYLSAVKDGAYGNVFLQYWDKNLDNFKF